MMTRFVNISGKKRKQPQEKNKCLNSAGERQQSLKKQVGVIPGLLNVIRTDRPTGRPPKARDFQCVFVNLGFMKRQMKMNEIMLIKSIH